MGDINLALIEKINKSHCKNKMISLNWRNMTIGFNGNSIITPGIMHRNEYQIGIDSNLQNNELIFPYKAIIELYFAGIIEYISNDKGINPASAILYIRSHSGCDVYLSEILNAMINDGLCPIFIRDPLINMNSMLLMKITSFSTYDDKIQMSPLFADFTLYSIYNIDIIDI